MPENNTNIPQLVEQLANLNIASQPKIENIEIINKVLDIKNPLEIELTIQIREKYDKEKNYIDPYFGMILKEYANFLLISEIDNKYLINEQQKVDYVSWKGGSMPIIVRVNNIPISSKEDFKNAVNGEETIVIDIDHYKKRYQYKHIPFINRNLYPLTFLDLFKHRNNYDKTSDDDVDQKEREKNSFINVLTRCEYKVCISDYKKIISSTLKHGKYQKLFNDSQEILPFAKEENLKRTITKDDIFTVHGYIFVYDPLYKNSFTFDLVSNGKMCQISIPALNNKCMDKESEWFSITNENLNLYIDKDINYKICNLKGELFRFLWKYISYLEISYYYKNDGKFELHKLITKKLKDYRIKRYEEQKVNLNKTSYKKKNADEKDDKKLKKLEEIDNKIDIINKTNILDEFFDITVKHLKKDSNHRKGVRITIYLPYPEIKYNFFGVGLLSSNYKKHINCQKFINKMFGSKLIKSLNLHDFDYNRYNYNRLESIKHIKDHQEEVSKEYLNEDRFHRPDKNMSENEEKIKKEKLLRQIYTDFIKSKNTYTDNKLDQYINKLGNNNKNSLTNENKNTLKKSITLKKSKKKKDIKNIMKGMTKNELDTLLINSKLKIKLIELQKKKKSKLKTLINSLKSNGKQKNTKFKNNRQVRIRKRLLREKLKKIFPQENNIEENISISNLVNIQTKYYKNRIEMITKLLRANNTAKNTIPDLKTHTYASLYRLKYNNLLRLYNKLFNKVYFLSIKEKVPNNFNNNNNTNNRS